MKITKQRLKEIIKEEMDAMRGADRPGAGIEDIAAVEDEETRDRAFGSPEERLITLINARDVLNKMTRDELEDLSMSLDAPMVATLRHILANPMYAPMEESDDVVEGQYETGAQRAARERAREAKIRELMRTQGLSRSAAEQFAGRSYSQTR
jgi:hypothetical protein